MKYSPTATGHYRTAWSLDYLFQYFLFHGPETLPALRRHNFSNALSGLFFNEGISVNEFKAMELCQFPAHTALACGTVTQQRQFYRLIPDH